MAAQKAPASSSRSRTTATSPPRRACGRRSPPPATATSARAAPRSGRTPTTCTTRAPTPTAATTGRPRSWAACRSSNEDLVNLPNWLVLKLRIEGEEALRLANVELLVLPPRVRHPHARSCAHAALPRPGRSRDHAAQPALRQHGPRCTRPAIEWTLTPENWSGRVEVISALDGRVTNRGVARYRELEGRHLDPVSPRTFGPEVIALKVAHAPVAHLRRAGGPHARLPGERAGRRAPQPPPDGGLHPAGARLRRDGGRAGARREDGRVLHLARPRDQRAAGQRRQVASALPGRSARRCERHRSGVGRALGAPATWSCPRDERVQLLLRLHIAHVLQVCSRAHGRPRRRRPRARPERRGLPRPRVLGRALRLSRSSTSACREITPRAAACTATAAWARPGRRRGEAGYRGAMFPWQSGSDGQEETQVVHLNPLSGQLGARPQPQPAPRERRDLLQRLALLPGDRRRRVPARLRRGDDARDRALLGLASRTTTPSATATRSTA